MRFLLYLSDYFVEGGLMLVNLFLVVILLQFPYLFLSHLLPLIEIHHVKPFNLHEIVVINDIQGRIIDFLRNIILLV